MIKPNAKITNVIIVTNGEEVTYFTLEGVEIGGFNGGHRIVPDTAPEPEPQPKGGVVTAPKPEAVKRAKEREAGKAMTLEERTKYEQETNA